MSLPLMR